MSLDRALDGVPFRVDLFRCHEAARRLTSFVPEHQANVWDESGVETKIAFKTLFISICHQFNWDFLQSALATWLLPNTNERLDEFSKIKPADIRQLLSSYPRQERVRAEQRTQLLRQTAAELKALMTPNGPLEKLLIDPTLNGPGGFYDLLSQITAYRGDPLEKKPRVLAHDLYRENILKFRDPENLKPAVEYHLIRLYLRTGRVFPTRPEVRLELSGEATPARPRLVKVLRQSVDEAMRHTAFYAGLDIATLNYIEWQIARTTCDVGLTGETARTRCLAKADHDMPGDIQAISPDRCAFSDFCRSLTDEKYGWYSEPHFQKAIY